MVRPSWLTTGRSVVAAEKSPSKAGCDWYSFGLYGPLKVHSEPELHRAVLRRGLLQVVRAALLSGDAPIRLVEHVERFADEIDAYAIPHWNPLLQAHVRLVLRRLDVVVARDYCSVGTQPRAAAGADAAQVAAVGRRTPYATAEVVKPAHLEALPDFPDSADHEAMPLVGVRQCVFVPEVRRQIARHDREPAQCG